jgi:hypothetical protein
VQKLEMSSHASIYEKNCFYFVKAFTEKKKNDWTLNQNAGRKKHVPEDV